MLKCRRHRRLLATVLMTALVFTSFTVVSFGGSGTKKMTVYDEVVVSGNYAYCSAAPGIYRVNLKTNKVKRIVDNSEYYTITGPLFGMKVHKGYLYYMGTGGIGSPLHRVKKSGGKTKYLCVVDDYAIKKGKIYYQAFDVDKDKSVKKVMKLNGKNKKKSSYKVKNKYKKSNKKGYKVKYVKTGKKEYSADLEDYVPVVKAYLVRPGKKNVLLCTFLDENEVY